MGPLARHNVIFGENGSGKTSLLETAHILGTARSFRSGSPKSHISYNTDAFVVQGIITNDDSGSRSLGVRRERNGDVQLRLAGQAAKSVSELADELPLLVLNAQSFDLLQGEPANRRRFMDWGVFHVEHTSRHHRNRFQRALVQRNHLLRRDKLASGELEPWTRELAEHGEAIAKSRGHFIAELLAVFKPLMQSLAPEIGEVELSYRRGWDAAVTYENALLESWGTDRQQGYTQKGPQRGDIRFTVDGHSAADTLSRGQQKLVVCGLKLAQGRILSKRGSREVLYLVDDLPAELDRLRCERICRELASMRVQSMITAIDEDAIPGEWLASDYGEASMFHVKHGSLRTDEEQR